MKNNFKLNMIILLIIILCSQILHAQIENTDSDEQDIQDSTDEALPRESKLELGLGFNSHSSYRGRDNGIYDQYYFSPSVSYIHKSGFSLSLSTFILHRSPNFFDETSLGVAYDAEISDNFSFSLSYSRFWYSINSFLSKSDLDNSVEASFSVNSFGFTLNPVISVDFGTYTEANLFLYFSWLYEVDDAFGIMDLSVEPSFLYVLGEQNKNLVASRKKKGHGNPTDLSKLKNYVSSMDYEFTLPVSLDFRQFIIKPYVSLIIPVNVLDNSTKDPFAAIGIDFTYIIR